MGLTFFFIVLMVYSLCALNESIPPPTRQRGGTFFVFLRSSLYIKSLVFMLCSLTTMRLVPYFEEAVPATCAHGHPVLRDAQAGHTVVMTG